MLLAGIAGSGKRNPKKVAESCAVGRSNVGSRRKGWLRRIGEQGVMKNSSDSCVSDFSVQSPHLLP